MMKNVPVHEAATRGKNTTHQQLEAGTPPTPSDVCLKIPVHDAATRGKNTTHRERRLSEHQGYTGATCFCNCY
jgi:hypothetical protein